MEWTNYISIGFFQAIITGVVWFLASYLKTKGKNLATSEDIDKITDKIESVKIAYAKELEGLKSQLNARFHAQTLRFEKEFNVLQDVWTHLIDLRDAGEAFTPGFKSGPIDESKAKERFGEAYYNLLKVIDVQKPFSHKNSLSFSKTTGTARSSMLESMSSSPNHTSSRTWCPKSSGTGETRALRISGIL
jgi:hypothetical protein